MRDDGCGRYEDEAETEAEEEALCEVEMPNLCSVGGTDESNCLEQDADEHWGLGAKFSGDDCDEGCDEERDGKLDAADECIVDGCGGAEHVVREVVREIYRI